MRKVSCEATPQEALGATIVLRDDPTYAQQHVEFSLIDRAAPISATRTEQLPTMWTGTSKMEPSATGVTACYLAVHNVDSSFSHARPAQYAPAKRRMSNHNSRKPEEGLHRVETTTGPPVLNRPPKRDSFNATLIGIVNGTSFAVIRRDQGDGLVVAYTGNISNDHKHLEGQYVCSLSSGTWTATLIGPRAVS